MFRRMVCQLSLIFSALSQQGHLSGNTWFYLIPDHLTVFYGELIVSQSLTSDISYSLGLQYDWGQDSGEAR